MKHRRVFSAPSLAVARAAISAARSADVRDEDISLIARSDIELDSIPKDRLDVSMDMVPAALRGAIGGGSLGLLAGLIAVAVPPLGITVGGAALIAAASALAGSWSAALMGSAVPNSVRRKFEREIEDGRILVVIDVQAEAVSAADAAIAMTGAEPRTFDAPSLLT